MAHCDGPTKAGDVSPQKMGVYVPIDGVRAPVLGLSRHGAFFHHRHVVCLGMCELQLPNI